MSAAAIAIEFQDASPVATDDDERERPLPLRGDTFLGVCEAVGQDFGFHPNWLRIPFAALILWNPLAVIAAYLGLGCIVALSRWLYPAPPSNAPEARSASPAPAAQEDEEKLAIAA